MVKKSFINVFNAKKHFPISGKGWVVQRVKQPTMKSGSKILWAKTFKTEKEARAFAIKKKR